MYKNWTATSCGTPKEMADTDARDREDGQFHEMEMESSFQGGQCTCVETKSSESTKSAVGMTMN